MDASTQCQAADLLREGTPVLLALVTGGFAWLTGLAKGKRTPRREEIALRAEHEALKEQVRTSPPPPEPAP